MVTSAVAIIEPHLTDIGNGVHIVGRGLAECFASMRERRIKMNKIIKWLIKHIYHVNVEVEKVNE